MPGYKTHLTASSVSGAVIGAAAFCLGDFSAVHSIFAGSLCAIGGLIPDMDSPASQSFRRCMSILSSFCTLMLVCRLRDFSISPETAAILGGGNYLFCWYVVGGLIQKWTVHRGMCHSIPTAVIAAELMYLLSSGENSVRMLNCAGLGCGVLVHLVLDEIYSIGREGAVGVQVKKSLGTALKLVDFDNKWGTFTAYSILLVITYLVINSTAVTENWQQKADSGIASSFAEKHKAYILDLIRTKSPDDFDKAVLTWAVENQMIISPAVENNPKWADLQRIADE